MVLGSGVMTWATFCPDDCTYSVASLPGPSRNSSQRGLCRWVPSSPRRRKSPSVTMPTSWPWASTTGRPLILFCSISRTARVTDASGSTVIVPHVMTSCAFMTYLLRVIDRPGSSRVQAAERRTVAQNNPPRRRQLDRCCILQRGERARDCLDGETQIVGNILARHRQLDGIAIGDAVRHLEQEPCHPLLRSLDQQQ